MTFGVCEINVLALGSPLRQSICIQIWCPLGALSTKSAHMNYIYFLAVIGNRLIALFCILALSYLLPSNEFGIYAIASANALVVQILLASWLASSANKLLAAHDDDPSVTLSTIALGMVGVTTILALIGLGYALMPFTEAAPFQVALVLGWSATLMIYDVTLASKNALGEANAYAVLAITRNVLALTVSVALVLAGYGPTGAIIGQLVGNALPVLLLPTSRRIWLRVRLDSISCTTLRYCMIFGAAGTFALGQYILVNAASRNLVALTLGEAEAGQWALALDIFYGPLALLGTAYTLSRMRELYAGHDRKSQVERRTEMGKFVLVNLYFAVPYAIGGFLLAPSLATLLFAEQSLAGILLISQAATVQSAAMLALFGLTTVLLAIARGKLLITIVIGATLLVSGATLAAWAGGGGLAALMWAATLALAVTVVIAVGYASIRRYVSLDMKAVGRVVLAAATMGITVAGLQVVWPAAFYLHLIAGIVCYGVLTIVLRPIELHDFVPKESLLARKMPFLR